MFLLFLVSGVLFIPKHVLGERGLSPKRSTEKPRGGDSSGLSSALNAWRLALGMPVLLLSSAWLAQYLSTLSSASKGRMKGLFFSALWVLLYLFFDVFSWWFGWKVV